MEVYFGGQMWGKGADQDPTALGQASTLCCLDRGGRRSIMWVCWGGGGRGS